MTSRFVSGLAVLAVLCGSTCTFASVGESRPVAARGFSIEVIAHVPDARELAALPNGDLLVGTSGDSVDVIADATGTPEPARVFTRLPDGEAAGVTLAGDTIYVGTQFGVWRLPYRAGERTASAPPQRIASVRTSGVSSDHVTTSVAVAGNVLFAGVGSSCNACDPDLDATRASIQAMRLDGSGMHPRADHIRNPIALAVDPTNAHLWAGVAGQDELAHGHPYEIFDDISAQAAPVANYGWPHCYEDRRPVTPDRDCSKVAVSRVVFPAYETPIGAAFYPAHPTGAYAFPEAFRGGAFVALHGSWHRPLVPPRVVFVPMRGDGPSVPIDWNDPNEQWQEFVGGFQTSTGARIGRPTGIAVGPDGSLFVADDGAGVVYRIRPSRSETPGR